MPVKNTDELKLHKEKFDNKGGSILGLLKGPIADTEHSTRNGRTYSRELWERVFNSPLAQEQFKNGGILGELDHPADRDEVLLSQAAVKLTEKPVEKDGLLYGTFEILNTPQGNIVYNLAKSGISLGVSSRGNGDVDPYTNEVDPTSYDFTCYDIVYIPAVEKARLTLYEGKGQKPKNRSYAQYNHFNELMKETIKNADPSNKQALREEYGKIKHNLWENLNDPVEWETFKKENPEVNAKFDWKKYGVYFDKEGTLVDVTGFNNAVSELLTPTKLLSKDELKETPITEEETKEGITKTSKGKWVNKGKEGTHGEFKTKKAARQQQKAMFANGFKEDLEGDLEDTKSENDSEDKIVLDGVTTSIEEVQEHNKKLDDDNWVVPVSVEDIKQESEKDDPFGQETDTELFKGHCPLGYKDFDNEDVQNKGLYFYDFFENADGTTKGKPKEEEDDQQPYWHEFGGIQDDFSACFNSQKGVENPRIKYSAYCLPETEESFKRNDGTVTYDFTKEPFLLYEYTYYPDKDQWKLTAYEGDGTNPAFKPKEKNGRYDLGWKERKETTTTTNESVESTKVGGNVPYYSDTIPEDADPEHDQKSVEYFLSYEDGDCDLGGETNYNKAVDYAINYLANRPDENIVYVNKDVFHRSHNGTRYQTDKDLKECGVVKKVKWVRGKLTVLNANKTLESLNEEDILTPWATEHHIKVPDISEVPELNQPDTYPTYVIDWVGVDYDEDENSDELGTDKYGDDFASAYKAFRYMVNYFEQGEYASVNLVALIHDEKTGNILKDVSLYYADEYGWTCDIDSINDTQINESIKRKRPKGVEEKMRRIYSRKFSRVLKENNYGLSEETIKELDEIIENVDAVGEQVEVDCEGKTVWFSVYVKDKNSGWGAWLDCHVDEYEDFISDWNQYIFTRSDKRDMENEYLQDNDYMYQDFDRAAYDKVLELGYIMDSENGTKVNLDLLKEKGLLEKLSKRRIHHTSARKENMHSKALENFVYKNQKGLIKESEKDEEKPKAEEEVSAEDSVATEAPNEETHDCVAEFNAKLVSFLHSYLDDKKVELGEEEEQAFVELFSSTFPDIIDFISANCEIEPAPKGEEDIEPVGDAEGDDEIMIQLQGQIEENVKLRKGLKGLQEEKAVINDKVSKLQEQVRFYKNSASNANKKAKQLNENIASTSKLSEKIASLRKELESLRASKSSSEKEVSSLKESLTNLKQNSVTREELSNTKKTLQEKLDKATKQTAQYKKELEETYSKYIVLKARNIGSTPQEISNKLTEGYTVADIDKVVDDLEDTYAAYSRLPSRRNNQALRADKVHIESESRILNSYTQSKEDLERDRLQEAMIRASQNRFK